MNCMVSDVLRGVFLWGCFFGGSESRMYHLSQCLYLYVMLFFAWDIGISLSTDTSSYSLSRHRKMSFYMYLKT